MRTPPPLTLPLVGAEGGRDPWLAREETAKQSGGVFWRARIRTAVGKSCPSPSLRSDPPHKGEGKVPSKPMYSFAYNLMRPATLSLLALILCSAAACSTTAPRTPPAAMPAAQGDQPEPPTPGIKPLTVEQEEQVGGN